MDAETKTYVRFVKYQDEYWKRAAEELTGNDKPPKPDTEIRVVNSRDIKALDIPDNVDTFTFFDCTETREADGKITKDKPFNFSPVYAPRGTEELLTLEQLQTSEQNNFVRKYLAEIQKYGAAGITRVPDSASAFAHQGGYNWRLFGNNKRIYSGPRDKRIFIDRQTREQIWPKPGVKGAELISAAVPT